MSPLSFQGREAISGSGTTLFAAAVRHGTTGPSYPSGSGAGDPSTLSDPQASCLAIPCLSPALDLARQAAGYQ
jgi:hypothetical protein